MTSNAFGSDPAYVDDDGVLWWSFLYEYDWDGATFTFEVCARSQVEADARLKRLPLARSIGRARGSSIPHNAVARWKKFKKWFW